LPSLRSLPGEIVEARTKAQEDQKQKAYGAKKEAAWAFILKGGENMTTEWRVYRNGKEIDRVFFDDDCDREYVRDALINHDNYPADIEILRTQRRKEAGNG